MSLSPENDASADHDPDWLHAALSHFREEIVLYGRTGIACFRNPREFGRAFRTGTLEAMPPLSFFGASLGIITLVNQQGLAWAGLTLQGSFWQQLAVEALSYLKYVLIALIAHPLMRAFGSRRRWRSSLALSLYAGGGPSTWTGVLVALPTLLLVRSFGQVQLHSLADFRHLPPHVLWASAGISVFALLSLIVYLVVFARAMAGLHQVATWKAAAALLLGLLIANVAVTSARVNLAPVRRSGAGLQVGVNGLSE